MGEPPEEVMGASRVAAVPHAPRREVLAASAAGGSVWEERAEESITAVGSGWETTRVSCRKLNSSSAPINFILYLS